MFDVLSAAMTIYPTVDLKEKPRMADFAVWGCAIAEALGRSKEEFLEAYIANIKQVNREALAESVIGGVMLAFADGVADWEGTATQLHNELEMLADAHGIDVKGKMWAKTPRALGKRLRLIMPNLRKEGVMVEMGRSGKERTIRVINTLYLEKKTSQTSQTSPDGEKSGIIKRHQTSSNVTNDTGAAGAVTFHNPAVTFDDVWNSAIKRRQEHVNDVSDVSDVSAPTLEGTGVCGKCNRELTGQTFQGPAGTGMICADCQAELDQASGLGTITGEQLAMMIKSAIYKLGYVRNIHEFASVEVLMELPKGTGITTEKIETYLATHTAELKITRPAGGKWRQVTA